VAGRRRPKTRAAVRFRFVRRRKPGSSPDMAIVPQPKCEPTNVGLIRTQWTIYSRPPEEVSRVSQNRAAVRFRFVRRRKPGSSPDMAIVPQPKCEPTNVGLIRTQWTIYSWPPE
jgi:hypothetical protein